jgi:hypothetical protein
VLLDEHAGESEMRGRRGDLAGVVRLDAADRDKRVATLCKRVCDEVLELAGLVASVGKPRVAVLPLRPDLDAAPEVLAQPLEPVDRRGPEEQRNAGVVAQLFCVRNATRSAILASPRPAKLGITPLGKPGTT